MRAYGMTRLQNGDNDVAGCAAHGRATTVYSVDGHSYRSLRGGKKSRHRRWIKRQARIEGKRACRDTG